MTPFDEAMGPLPKAKDGELLVAHTHDGEQIVVYGPELMIRFDPVQVEQFIKMLHYATEKALEMRTRLANLEGG